MAGDTRHGNRREIRGLLKHACRFCLVAMSVSWNDGHSNCYDIAQTALERPKDLKPGGPFGNNLLSTWTTKHKCYVVDPIALLPEMEPLETLDEFQSDPWSSEML